MVRPIVAELKAIGATILVVRYLDLYGYLPLWTLFSVWLKVLYTEMHRCSEHNWVQPWLLMDCAHSNIQSLCSRHCHWGFQQCLRNSALSVRGGCARCCAHQVIRRLSAQSLAKTEKCFLILSCPLLWCLPSAILRCAKPRWTRFCNQEYIPKADQMSESHYNSVANNLLFVQCHKFCWMRTLKCSIVS